MKQFRCDSKLWALGAAAMLACATSQSAPADGRPKGVIRSHCTILGPIRGNHPVLRYQASQQQPLLVMVKRTEDDRTIEVLRQTGAGGEILVELGPVRALNLANLSVDVMPCGPPGDCNPPLPPIPPRKGDPVPDNAVLQGKKRVGDFGEERQRPVIAPEQFSTVHTETLILQTCLIEEAPVRR